jgi:SAM-dependent methyltransferase
LSRLCGDGTDLPFHDGSFSHVVLLSSLEHVEDDHGLLGECRRVLVPAGLLALTTDACSENVMSPGERLAHMKESLCSRTYDRAELRRLLESSGFAVEAISYVFGGRWGVLLGKLSLRRFRYLPLMYLSRPLLARTSPDGGLMVFALARRPGDAR